MTLWFGKLCSQEKDFQTYVPSDLIMVSSDLIMKLNTKEGFCFLKPKNLRSNVCQYLSPKNDWLTERKAHTRRYGFIFKCGSLVAIYMKPAFNRMKIIEITLMAFAISDFYLQKENNTAHQSCCNCNTSLYDISHCLACLPLWYRHKKTSPVYICVSLHPRNQPLKFFLSN